MNNLWSKIVINTVYRKKSKAEKLSPFELARGLRELRLAIARIDPNAFVVRNSVKDTKGGMIKKRRLH